MTKYVDSQKVKDLLLHIANGRDEHGDIYAAILALDKLPCENVSPKEPCEGRKNVWVKTSVNGMGVLSYRAFVCGNCGYDIKGDGIADDYNYCPHCGAWITEITTRKR